MPILELFRGGGAIHPLILVEGYNRRKYMYYSKIFYFFSGSFMCNTYDQWRSNGGGGQGGARVPPVSKIIAKNREKSGKRRENREKRKNREEKAKIGKILLLCSS